MDLPLSSGGEGIGGIFRGGGIGGILRGGGGGGWLGR